MDREHVGVSFFAFNMVNHFANLSYLSLLVVRIYLNIRQSIQKRLGHFASYELY